MSLHEEQAETSAPAKKVDVWSTDALLALAKEHGIELSSVIPQLTRLREGKVPLGNSGVWIEFWTIEQGSPSDGLYLRHAAEGGVEKQELS